MARIIKMAPQGGAEERILHQFTPSASDAKGHSERMWVRVPPAIAREIEIIVQSKQWPYRSTGDFLRHGINNLLEYLSSMQPNEGMTSTKQMVEACGEVLREEEFHMSFENTLERLTNLVNTHLARGEKTRARFIVTQVLERVRAMPDGFWRDQYLASILQKYAKLAGEEQK